MLYFVEVGIINSAYTTQKY